MSRSWILLTVILMVAGAAPALAQDQSGLTVVTGTLLGGDGKTLPVAHVYVRDPLGRKPIAMAVPDSGGRFAVATYATGVLMIEFTAPDHQRSRVTVVADTPTRLQMDVRLTHNTYLDSLGAVKVIGDFNAFDFATAREMARQPDGTYTLEVKPSADTLSYQLVGVFSETRSINGTQSDRFSYDGGGDYRSVIDVGDDTGTVTITFDPAALVRVESTEKFAFTDSSSRAVRGILYMKAMEERDRKMREQYAAAREANDTAWRYDYSKDLARTTALLETERDPLLRQLLIVDGLEMARQADTVPRGLAQRALEEVPPSSPWWALPSVGQLYLMTFAIEVADNPDADHKEFVKNQRYVDRLVQYLDSVVTQNPSEYARTDALSLALGMLNASGQKERANRYFVQLTTEYPNSSSAEVARARYAPDRVFRVGATVPDFRFTSLEDSSVVYTRESMKGSVYMLDFWAVWCGPCIGEMPFLQTAHEKYKDRGFRILSISLDESPGDVQEFREDEWEMPWLHSFVAGGFESPVMKQFEIMFIPRAALVDEKGTIIAVDGELRRERLEKTLAGVTFPQTP